MNKHSSDIGDQEDDDGDKTDSSDEDEANDEQQSYAVHRSEHDSFDLNHQLSCINLAVGEAVGRVTIFRNVEQMSLSDPLVIQPEIPSQMTQLSDDDEDDDEVHHQSESESENNRNNNLESNNNEEEAQDESDYNVDKFQSFNSVLSVCIADVDADGLNEILVGTYAKTLLIFKIYVDEERSRVTYRLARTMKFPGPIHSIKLVDINKDGADEVFVCSMYGVHVLQPNLTDFKSKVVQRLKAMLALQQLAS